MEKKLNFIIIGLSIFLIYESIKISGIEITASSPGAFPLFISALLLIFSIWIFIEGRGKKVAQLKESLFSKDIIVFIVVLIIYGYVLELVGFQIATLGFLLSTMSYLSKGKIFRNLIVSLLSVAFITLIFKTVFKVILP